MKYFLTTLKHKWYVLLAGLKLGNIPLWRLIVHDWSKFTSYELPHYNRQFFGDKDDPEGFARAWLHHQNFNPHHWEYWRIRSEHVISNKGVSTSAVGYLEMPETYVREMVADWMGASKAYTGSWDMSAWLRDNFAKWNVLHENTRLLISSILRDELGYPFDMDNSWGID